MIAMAPAAAHGRSRSRSHRKLRQTLDRGTFDSALAPMR